MAICRVAGAENVLTTGEQAGADIPKEPRVRIWKLKPLDTRLHDWEASTYLGDVIVRAENEEDARHLAADAFGVVPKKVPGQDTPVNPWLYPWLVEAEVLEESDYDPEGDELILYPQLMRPAH